MLPVDDHGRSGDREPFPVYSGTVRKRWFSRRAVFLHIEFSLLASGCLVAGWWQVTRALSGNGLSWFYSAEWPGFALIAVYGWWHLIHEDPEALKARKQRPPEWDAVDGMSDGRLPDGYGMTDGRVPGMTEGSVSDG
jgi:hypothetical protein